MQLLSLWFDFVVGTRSFRFLKSWLWWCIDSVFLSISCCPACDTLSLFKINVNELMWVYKFWINILTGMNMDRYRICQDCCIWMVPNGVDVPFPLTGAVLRGFQHFVCVHMLPCGLQGHLSMNHALQLCNLWLFLKHGEAFPLDLKSCIFKRKFKRVIIYYFYSLDF